MTVFYNCVGHDLPDYHEKAFDSMVVQDGRVSEIGWELHTFSRFAHATKVDLGGQDVFPAFADAHTHFLQTGLMLAGCNLSRARSIADVMALLDTFARSCSDEWLLAWNLDETLLKENRLPTIAELDRVISKHKAWISRVDLHSAVPNSQALKWARSAEPDAAPENGRFIKGTYARLAGRLFGSLSEPVKRACLERARDAARAKGIASVHALEGGGFGSLADVELVADFLAQPGFHGVVYHQSEDSSLARRRGWPRLGGCLFIDGSFGSRTAALQEPYTDAPENHGTLYMDRDHVETLISLCYKQELQLAVHAIGDRALRLITEAHAWVRERFPRSSLAHRIEHFELPDNESIRWARDAGIQVSVQPAFEALWGGNGRMYEQRLGPERIWQTNPFKTLMNNGIPLAGGSDSPVTPLDPFLGLHGFINHPNEKERIDLNAALAAFILEPHRFAGTDHERGYLRRGYLANFVCLSANPFLTRPSDLQHLEATRLFVEGREVYSKSPIP